MNKNYNKFNLLSLAVIILLIFFLTGLFEDSDKTVEFYDEGLEESVRDSIRKEEGEIYYKDVENIQVLNASNRNIKNLSGIEALTELRELDLEDNYVEDVSPLKNLMKLQDLNLRNNEITNLEDINFQDIIKLSITKLSLRHNVKRDEDGNGTRLEDISLLGNMVSLKNLKLRDNHIKDLRPISNLRKLKKLDIRENKFDNIEPLETLTKLEKLNIRDNKTESLEPLNYLTRLEYLNIHSNKKVESLEPIKNLINLETLIMRNVEINDAIFLENLTKLQRFNAIDTGIEDLAPNIMEKLLNAGALQGEVRPVRMLETLEAPVFSRDSGFYTDEFELDLAQKNEKYDIYYTLDGSEPTMSSNLYDSPIDIREINNNVASIVRAKVLTEENTMSETITKTYFTDGNIDSRFNLPVFSLVTDPENIFDEETGIYTEENAHNRGSDWERPVHVEYFEPTGELSLAQNAGVRIHGNYTRKNAQKSLRLYADSEYDSKKSIKNVFFKNLKDKSNHDIDSFENIILRTSGDDWNRTKFADGFMQELAEPLKSFDTQAYKPSVIFINGEYYGIQNIRERLDEYYLENHYNIDKNDVVILRRKNKLYRGNNKDVYHYDNMLKYIEENDLKESKHLNYIETQMDFDSFIDYFATEIYYGNADWPHNNIQFWRKTTDEYIENAPYGHDGRWRWMMFDNDASYYFLDRKMHFHDQPMNHNHNTIRWVMDEYDGRTGEKTWPNFLFRQLMRNEKFKNEFLVRFNDIANGYLNEYASGKIIDEKVSSLKKEIPYEVERWGAISSEKKWYSEIEKKKIFARERSHIIRKFIMEEFNIDNTVSVDINNETDEGFVRLNEMDITNELPGNNGDQIWSGIYFKEIPISVEAVGKDGYTFSHWEGIDSNESYVEINPTENLQLKPVFMKE